MIFDKNEGFAWISYLQANRGFKAGKRLFCTDLIYIISSREFATAKRFYDTDFDRPHGLELSAFFKVFLYSLTPTSDLYMRNKDHRDRFLPPNISAIKFLVSEILPLSFNHSARLLK